MRRRPSRCCAAPSQSRKAALPADHPDTALTLAALGGYHSGEATWPRPSRTSAGRCTSASSVLGADHPLTLGTLDNLAKAMLELDRLDEAEALQPAGAGGARSAASGRTTPRPPSR